MTSVEDRVRRLMRNSGWNPASVGFITDARASFREAIAEALEEAAADLERWAALWDDARTRDTNGRSLPGSPHSCDWDGCCAEDAIRRAAARVRARKDRRDDPDARDAFNGGKLLEGHGRE